MFGISTVHKRGNIHHALFSGKIITHVCPFLQIGLLQRLANKGSKWIPLADPTWHERIQSKKVTTQRSFSKNYVRNVLHQSVRITPTAPKYINAGKKRLCVEKWEQTESGAMRAWKSQRTSWRTQHELRPGGNDTASVPMLRIFQEFTNVVAGINTRSIKVTTNPASDDIMARDTAKWTSAAPWSAHSWPKFPVLPYTCCMVSRNLCVDSQLNAKRISQSDKRRNQNRKEENLLMCQESFRWMKESGSTLN